jgi:hypothetical protein
VIQVLVAVILHLPIHHHAITPDLHPHPALHPPHHLALHTQVIAAPPLHLVEIQAAVLMTVNATASVILN